MNLLVSQGIGYIMIGEVFVKVFFYPLQYGLFNWYRDYGRIFCAFDFFRQKKN